MAGKLVSELRTSMQVFEQISSTELYMKPRQLPTSQFAPPFDIPEVLHETHYGFVESSPAKKRVPIEHTQLLEEVRFIPTTSAHAPHLLLIK